ncbi:type II secretion system F family protein [Vibrio agarivorans]|uniref:Type II secretion system F family protein n=1 Tax=Vibrio agarivorans TaxID=153622 RepID=A0ABT7Y6Q5_9VIBR|nr:type II secretion system F family protein [Vibrio agarivorans]MDN2483726.1 type II secretion system F family protein [Vibrio agarivorans]
MIERFEYFVLLLIIGGVLLLLLSMRSDQEAKQVSRFLDDNAKQQTSATKFSLMGWLESAVPKSLASNQDEINEKFSAAGFYSTTYTHLYMPAKYAALAAGSLIIYLSLGADDLTALMAVMAVWVIAALILPDILLDSRIKAYRADVSGKLPYLIDLLAVCVQTGMTLEASFAYLAHEMKGFDPKMAKLVGKANDRAHIVGLDKSLDELYLHIPTSEMRSFVMTLKQSLQYGSSIYSVLTTLSADIREVNMLTLEEKIGKLAAKMSVPLILFIMVPIVILIAAPGVMRMMSGA